MCNTAIINHFNESRIINVPTVSKIVLLVTVITLIRPYPVKDFNTQLHRHQGVNFFPTEGSYTGREVKIVWF